MGSQDFVHNCIAGAIGGGAGVFVGHPFDTVKVQLQVASGSSKYGGILDCFNTVKAQTLSKGFFRGLSWPLISYAAMNSIFFGAYSTSLSYFKSVTSDTGWHHYTSIFAAGSCAGVAQLPLAIPVDCIKVLLQSQIPHNQTKGSVRTFHHGPISAARDILRKRGIAGLFRGCPTQFCRDVPASGVYMTVFDFLIDLCAVKFPSIPSQAANFIGGGVAGVVSWLVILPLDVIKSRLQSDPERKIYKGALDCAVKSYNSDGGRIFFRGAVAMSTRAFIVNAVTLMVYKESLVALAIMSR